MMAFLPQTSLMTAVLWLLQATLNFIQPAQLQQLLHDFVTSLFTAATFLSVHLCLRVAFVAAGADRADGSATSFAFLGYCYSSVRRARDFWDRCDVEVGDTGGWRQALSSVASLKPSSSYSRGQASASG